MNRRDFTAAALAAAVLARPSAPLAAPAPAAAGAGIAMLLYPGMTALDLVGPQALLAGLGEPLYLVAARPGPVACDTGLSLLATHDFAACPADLRVLFVPGGDGTPAQMRAPDVIAFLRDRGARAGWVASVCTGSLILGAAGLLDGYRATSHWCVRDAVLPRLGAVAVAGRVVFDRNRVTGAGISAGLDLGLALGARLGGETYARTAQLVAEYAPEPPFHAGTPGEAGPEITARADAVLADLAGDARRAAEALPPRGEHH